MQKKTQTALIAVLRSKLTESEASVGRLKSGLAAAKEVLARANLDREQ